MESLLFSIPLPGYGSINYKRDLDDSSPTIDVPTLSNMEQLGLGPDVEKKWCFNKRDQILIDYGPRELVVMAQFLCNDLSSTDASRSFKC